jgi:hypothetical protein
MGEPCRAKANFADLVSSTQSAVTITLSARGPLSCLCTRLIDGGAAATCIARGGRWWWW